MSPRIRRLGVMTSGCDSPGLNAAIRSVVRAGLRHSWQPIGIRSGFVGLLAGDTVGLNSRSVSQKIGLGGTFLGTSEDYGHELPGQLRDMLRNVNEAGLDALVVIGDRQSMCAAQALSDSGVPVMGVPATIENDLCGTDYAIGFDTAMNTGLDVLDRIRDTASAQEQAFVVEMAGQSSGHLALMVGIAGGAEVVCIPEVPIDLDCVTKEVSDAYVRGKEHCVIVVASGAKPSAAEIVKHLNTRRDETGFAVNLTVLGHIQRGGSPLTGDRLLATRLGAAAVDALHEGKAGLLVGITEGAITRTPLADITDCHRGIDEGYYALSELLAR